MLKLIKTDIIRLFRNKIFILGALGVWALTVCVSFIDKSGGTILYRFEPFSLVLYSTFVIAAITVFTVGSDKSEKTIRNKLCSGITKTQIYLSHLVTSFIGSLIISLSCLIGIIRLLCFAPVSISTILIYLVLVILSHFAITSLFVFVSMISKVKAVALILCIVICVIFQFGTYAIIQSLNEPEYVISHIEGQKPIYDSNGNTNGYMIKYSEERAKNENYIGGAKRKLYEAILYASPGRLLVNVQNYYANYAECGVKDVMEDFEKYFIENLKTDSYSAVSSIAFFAVITSLGICIFRKQDIN